MEKAKRQKPMWLEAPFLVGIALTFLILGFAVWSLSVGEVCNKVGWCVSKWEVLKDAPPNEIGDSLAGFAGTLAFVWLIVTVWLQATELREQREEFEKMADAQQEQVKLLVTQGEIFKDEQIQRDEARAERLFEAHLDAIREAVREAIEESYLLRRILKATVRYRGSFPDQVAFIRYDECQFPDSYVRELRDVSQEWKRAEKAVEEGRCDPTEVFLDVEKDDHLDPKVVEPVLVSLQEGLDVLPTLSNDQRVRAENMGVSEVYDFFCRIKDDSEKFVVRHLK